MYQAQARSTAKGSTSPACPSRPSAITEDGVLWVWGDGNNYGRLGTNSANDVLSPKRLLDNVQKADIGSSYGRGALVRRLETETIRIALSPCR